MTEGTVLITGASGGVGSAVAEEFAAREWRVVLCARSEEALESTGSAVSAAGGTPVVQPVDVRDENEVFLAVSEAVPGSLDVVIPAAATMPHPPGERPLDEEWYDDFQTVFETNVYGVFAAVRESLQLMPPDGRVLVPSGSVAREPTEGMGTYAVSKAAVEGMARGFAADVDQTVGVVDPGLVASDLTGGKGRDPEGIAGMFRWAALECPAEDLDGEILGLRDWKKATR
jgi:3-oxoacyl-[acyl-carrier protein] reductase